MFLIHSSKFKSSKEGLFQRSKLPWRPLNWWCDGLWGVVLKSPMEVYGKWSNFKGPFAVIRTAKRASPTRIVQSFNCLKKYRALSNILFWGRLKAKIWKSSIPYLFTSRNFDAAYSTRSFVTNLISLFTINTFCDKLFLNIYLLFIIYFVYLFVIYEG